MEYLSYTIHPSIMSGGASVPNRAVKFGSVVSDGQGRGHLDVYVAGQKERLQNLFETPIEIRNADGFLQKTLQPYSHEALAYLVEQGGLKRHGLAAELSRP